MKQTAVEWLVNVVQSCIVPDYIPKEIVEQAKEMEKEQIINAQESGFTDGCRYTTGFEQTLWYDGEQYYNETFKSE